jgi:phenylacetate-CoA ligase
MVPSEPAAMQSRAEQLIDIQRGLDGSQWQSSADLERLQFARLTTLASHAYNAIPEYRQRLRIAGYRPGRPMDIAIWQNIPVLRRTDLQRLGNALRVRRLSTSQFGDQFEASSSGSTGVPVRVWKSDLDWFMWQAICMREELWHGDDCAGTYAAIKGFAGSDFAAEQLADLRSPTGLILPDWGPPMNLVRKTGASALIHGSVSMSDKAAFLIRVQPRYLLTAPSGLRLLAQYFRDHDLRLPSLKSVRTVSERLDDDVRLLCQEVFSCKIVHNYSANEVGYMAVQCPQCTHYHVQSEVVYLEILDEHGAPCPPGRIGRVIVTPLHNFAMPLLRYEVGDEAEFGEPCSCGRGLPVIRNIIGRTADYLTLPDGSRRRVTYNVYRMSGLRAVREYQVVQTSLHDIEVRVVAARALETAETAEILDIMTREFGGDFRIAVVERDELPRTAAGKLRPFISELG